MKLPTSTYLHETAYGMADIVTWKDTRENISGIDIYLNTKFIGSIKPVSISANSQTLEKMVEEFLTDRFRKRAI